MKLEKYVLTVKTHLSVVSLGAIILPLLALGPEASAESMADTNPHKRSNVISSTTKNPSSCQEMRDGVEYDIDALTKVCDRDCNPDAVKLNEVNTSENVLKSCTNASDIAGPFVGIYDYKKGEVYSKIGQLSNAFQSYLMAAVKDHSPAMKKVAEMYESGTGVSKDQTKAAKWYSKAKDLKDKPAHVVIKDAKENDIEPDLNLVCSVSVGFRYSVIEISIDRSSNQAIIHPDPNGDSAFVSNGWQRDVFGKVFPVSVSERHYVIETESKWNWKYSIDRVTMQILIAETPARGAHWVGDCEQFDYKAKI